VILINASHLEKQDPNMKKKDFENELVQVRIFFNKHFASYRLKESNLACSSLTPTSTSPALALASTRNKSRSKAAPSTRANGLKIDLTWDRVGELKFGLMVPYTKDIGLRAKQMGRAV
jgi:hypothetical protein